MVLSQAAVKVLAKSYSQLKAQVEEDPLVSSLKWFWFQLLAGCWTEGLSFPLAVGQRPPFVLCLVGPYIGYLITWHTTSSERASKKSQSKVEVTTFKT